MISFCIKTTWLALCGSVYNKNSSDLCWWPVVSGSFLQLIIVRFLCRQMLIQQCTALSHNSAREKWPATFVKTCAQCRFIPFLFTSCKFEVSCTLNAAHHILANACPWDNLKDKVSGWAKVLFWWCLRCSSWVFVHCFDFEVNLLGCPLQGRLWHWCLLLWTR